VVVLGRREQDGVGRDDRPLELADRLGRAQRLRMLGVGRDRGETVVELELGRHLADLSEDEADLVSSILARVTGSTCADAEAEAPVTA
jgi:hypothetical protein